MLETEKEADKHDRCSVSFSSSYSLSPSTSKTGSCAFYNVTPAYPLFPSNILVVSQATFAGLVTDDLFYAKQGPLQVWDLLSGASTSVKVFINSNKTLVR